MTRATFRQQVGAPQRVSTLSVAGSILSEEIEATSAKVTVSFQSKFAPSDMRQLALVAHNHMKPAMKEFIEIYSEILKKFRITGTQTTMRMCKTLWGEDNKEVEYGNTCTSGPLGGDAQIAALMCMEDLGALIFFVDPLSAHPHQADIDSLVRLANCGNVIVCPNPTSAMSMMHTLKMALETGNRGMIPSFFETLESPAVAEYKHQQELALARAVNSGGGGGAPVANGSSSDPKEAPDAELEDVKATWLRASDHPDYDSDSSDYEDEAGDTVRTLPSAPPNRTSLLYGAVKQEKKRGPGRRAMKKMYKSMKKVAFA